MSLRRIVFLDNEAAVAGDDFGWSVAIKNDTISVGCPFDYVDGNKTGSAYLFDNLPGDLDADGDVDFLDFAVLADCWRQNNPLADSKIRHTNGG